MNGYIFAICGYAALLISIGWLAGRKVKSAAGFFVAGRKLDTRLLFSTLVAANIGAGSTVGVAAIAYKNGISAWWWIGSAGIGSLILAFFVGPKIWRIAVEKNLYTLGDYLAVRYSKAFRGIFSSMMAVGTLALFAGQLLGIAWILEVVAGVPKEAGVIAGAFVTTVYFAFGGLLSAAVVNMVEVVMILAGFAIAVPFIYSSVGGLQGLTEKIAQESYFALDGIGMTTIVGYLFMLVPSFFISPGLIGKVFGARDERVIKVGTALNGAVQLLFACIPVFIGMAAFAAFPNLSRADLALPTAMKEMMPFWAATLALGAIFAAEVSTADAVLYMIASSMSNDLYKAFFNPKISDEGLLKVGRGITVVAGVAGVLLALKLESIISALTIFYSLMSVSLAAPLVFGLFTRSATNAGAIASSICGVALTLFIEFFVPGKTIDFGFARLNAATCGILLSFAVMAASTAISRRQSRC